MNLNEFVKKVVELGIEAAKRDYKDKRRAAILKGSIDGFKACLDKNAIELGILYVEAQKKSNDVRNDDANDYWEKRGYFMEIEWVCNVVSAALYNMKLPVIIPPTARGMITAAEILEGTKKK